MKENIILICYSDRFFSNAKQKLIDTARTHGEVDKVRSFGPWNIDKKFYKQHKDILKYHRGSGYWLWKPYFIQKTLRTMNDNEYLLYMDAGSYFIGSVRPLIDLFSNNKPIICFELPYIEKNYTKRDCFIALNCDDPIYTETKQRIGGFHLWKKCDSSLRFVNEWLNFAVQGQLITDSPSKMPNYPGFIEHRHDQSIFSLLSKKYDLDIFRDISQLGNNQKHIYNNSPYNQIVELTRTKTKRRELTTFTRMKYSIYSSIRWGHDKRPQDNK